MTSMIKLRAKDGKILNVPFNVIKQMVTIQTMLDCPGVEDNNDEDDPIPIFVVNGEVLEKLIRWTKYHIENTDKPSNKVWNYQFFMDNLREIFVLEEAAKYLELRSYMNITEILMDENFQLLSNTEGFMRNISSDRFGELLSRDTLNVSNEQTVFESLVYWMSVNSEERSRSLEGMVPHIRAHFLPGKYIDEHVKTFLIKHGNPDLCEKLKYKSKTPRQGYEYVAVALFEMKDGRCLKYLDAKVGSPSN